MEKRYWYITPEDYEKAEKNGIKRDTVNQRVRRFGWDIESAITKKTNRVHLPKENTEKAKENKIDRQTLLKRIREGWSIEDACTIAIKKTGRPRAYPDWVYETAKKNGIKYTTVNQRIKSGWDLMKACTEEVK